MRMSSFFLVLGCVLFWASVARSEEGAARTWLSQFRHESPLVESHGVCLGHIGDLPSFKVTAETTGTHLVRVSIPFPPGALPEGMGLRVRLGDSEVVAGFRPLTFHPGKPVSVRRGIVTFPFEFEETTASGFALSLVDIIEKDQVSQAEWEETDGGARLRLNGVEAVLRPGGVTVTMADSMWHARLIAPERTSDDPPVAELIESNPHYVWARLLVYDEHWPRIVEVQMDSLGTVAVQGHIQRLGEGDGLALDLGWEITGPSMPQAQRHDFVSGQPLSPIISLDALWSVGFPAAHFLRRGYVETFGDGSAGGVRYLRCSHTENVPFQSTAWHRAAFVVGRTGHTPRDALLEPELFLEVPAESFDAIYGSGQPLDLSLWPHLDEWVYFTRECVKKSVRFGDDFGNITQFSERSPAPAFGMNRLNHCPAIFEEAWRSGDLELRKAAVLWCNNMFDLSLWWGHTEDMGGTRYNNAVAAGDQEHKDDRNFMWRGKGSVSFCTKGFESFFYAYEETGDPRMAAALRHQAAYAQRFVHVDQGECRNIGIVADFMRLYRCTGLECYREEALRLFRELRLKLSPGDLFSQGGQPIVSESPFIDDDKAGYQYPFAKPYIIGYALVGLPELLRDCPEEPKLRDVVRAVGAFLAESQDPVGGWRYPHPRSARVLLSQAMEHAAQLARAAAALEEQGENIEPFLDAIERVLQPQLGCFGRTGTVLSLLSGWENNPGALPEGKTIYDLYGRPEDRDPARDYREGAVQVGSAPPEGLVYATELLKFYLSHRPAERLFHANDAVTRVLERVEDRRIRLIPQEKGSFLRMERPENPEVGFVLWAPEWVTFPNLGYGQEELGGMSLGWRRDDVADAVWYTLECNEATFTASFVPHVDYVECAYTVWPKRGNDTPGAWALGPCQQMHGEAFKGDDEELLARLWFLSEGKWVSVAACAQGNPRNVLYVKGNPSPEMTGAMAESGWRTIQDPRPDCPLIACVSRDGSWVAATAAEHSTSICNNANASHRCIHSQGSMPLRKDGPTTLRVHTYLLRGTLDDLKRRYDRDVVRWRSVMPAPPPAVTRTEDHGVRAHLPAFADARVRSMDFPLAWPVPDLSFDQWRGRARRVYLEALGPPPPRAPFAPTVVAEEDRGSYVARKLALNISAYERIKAYLLVPKHVAEVPGNRLPAIVALHDHGAHFSIGKEKVVRPFAEPEAVMQDAQDWVGRYYGGRFIGDELASRGYVVFALDALFWGDRGRAEGVQYEDQQALAANLFQLGQSWAGTIVWDDVRSAEFVRGLPETDPSRIGCIGLSMGANRAWHLAAATDIVRAAAAICWMADTPTLMQEGNNQTVGYSAFSMLHPGLRNFLDFPDVASIACPKPMLFFNGAQDPLFPAPGAEAAYAKMQRVWAGQGVQELLATQLWPVPHEFNREMQAEAFTWLDAQLKQGR